MKIKIILFIVLFFFTAAIISQAYAQKVELIYTKAGLEQALEYKDAIHVSNATATNALSLMNASVEREKAYLNNLSGYLAVIIFGDSGVKAVNAIHYELPVFVVNSLENLSAKGSVIRIFESNFSGSTPGSTNVSDANSINFSKSDLNSKKTITLKCQGVNGAVVIQKLISILSN